MATIWQRLSTLEAKVTTLEGRVNGHATLLVDHGVRLAALEGSSASHGVEIGTLQAQVADLEARLVVVEDGGASVLLEGLEGRVDRLEIEVDRQDGTP